MVRGGMVRWWMIFANDQERRRVWQLRETGEGGARTQSTHVEARQTPATHLNVPRKAGTKRIEKEFSVRIKFIFIAFLAAAPLIGCEHARVRDLAQAMQEDVSALQRDEKAQVCLQNAEELRDAGSGKAADFYKQAIEAAPDSPFYRFAYADYLRQYRGPGQPLLPAAANEYYQALQRLDMQKEADRELLSLIDWGLTDTYQRDGLPLLYPSGPLYPTEVTELPVVFYSTQYEYGAEEVSIRDLTSGAFLTADTLNRQLTEAETRSTLRAKAISDWVNRVRIRPGSLPWLDIWQREVEAEDAIVDDWQPGHFFDLHELQQGIAAERTFDCYPFCDLSFRAGYKRAEWTTRRVGDDETETSNTPFGELWLSRVFPGYAGPNKLTLNVRYERSHIDHGPGYYRRGTISSATVAYSLYPEDAPARFTPRSTDIECGIVRYLQEYNEVDLRQQDMFWGITVREILTPRLDVSTRYTMFDEEKEKSDPERGHRQGAVSFAPVWRLIDNENAKTPTAPYSPLRLVNLVAPFDYQFSQRGPSDFESYGWGLRAEAKIAHPQAFRTTVLLFAECTRRQYVNLDKGLSLYTAGVKMGF